MLLICSFVARAIVGHTHLHFCRFVPADFDSLAGSAHKNHRLRLPDGQR